MNSRHLAAAAWACLLVLLMLVALNKIPADWPRLGIVVFMLLVALFSSALGSGKPPVR